MIAIKDIARLPSVQRCMGWFQEELEKTVQLVIDVQQIAAPTFAETARANFVEQAFSQLRLEDVHQDALNNVYARLPGSQPGSPVVISAHLDTVFPLQTDLTIQFESSEQNGPRIYGPGLADNSLGVAGLITLAAALKRFEITCQADIWFVANVGEEGLGDLQGIRAVVDRFGEATAYLIIEGGSYGNIFNQGIGVRRYQIDVSTPGGHSWGDFGSPSAIHELGKIVAEIDALPVKSAPKSSFNVGVIQGGTSVNTIAASASCQLDLRSADPVHLDSLTTAVMEIINRFDASPGIDVKMTKIGDRPTGHINKNEIPVNWAAEALEFVGCKEIVFLGGSTDANIPLSRGYPAVCIGLACAGNTHRIDEYFEPNYLPSGLSQLLLVALAASGVKE